MPRYLVRLANNKGYTPTDTRKLAELIRGLLGSKESIGHLRVTGYALEFDLFVRDSEELESHKKTLQSGISNLLTLKLLDQPPLPRDKQEILREGVGLFNEERFWECHEVLEQIWHPAKGRERDIIQGLILTAAALVHAQKEEIDVCISMLKKAKAKLGIEENYDGLNLDHVRIQIDRILETGNPEPFKLAP